jgi:hypothetical protein
MSCLSRRALKRPGRLEEHILLSSPTTEQVSGNQCQQIVTAIIPCVFLCSENTISATVVALNQRLSRLCGQSRAAAAVRIQIWNQVRLTSSCIHEMNQYPFDICCCACVQNIFRHQAVGAGGVHADNA